MLGKTHFALSLLISILFFYFFSFSFITNIFMLVFFLFGSLFPDVDTPKSILGRKMPLISMFTKHRGFFHTLFATALFSFLIYLIFNLKLALSFMSGYILHLMLDAITKEGIVFFGIRIRGPIKVGTVFEQVSYFFMLLISLFLIVKIVF